MVKNYSEGSFSRRGWAGREVLIDCLSEDRICYHCNQYIYKGDKAIKEGGRFSHYGSCETYAKKEEAKKKREAKKKEEAVAPEKKRASRKKDKEKKDADIPV